jgi:hypothetical protein
MRSIGRERRDMIPMAERGSFVIQLYHFVGNCPIAPDTGPIHTAASDVKDSDEAVAILAEVNEVLC